MGTPMAPQQQAEAAAALLDAVQAHKIVSYAAAGSVTVYLYDFLITFPDEVKYMWPSGLGVPKILFFMLRYYTIVHTSFAITYHIQSETTGEACKSLFVRDAYSSLMLGVIAEAITYVRVYAFSGSSRWVGGLLAVLFVGTHVAQFYFLAAFTESLRFANLPVEKHLGCIPLAGKGEFLSGIFIAILCSLTIATFIMIYVGWRRRQHSRGMRGLVRLFYNDGIFYFISLSTLAMTNIIVIRTAPRNGLHFVLVQAEVHLISLLAGRMLIHLRQWGHKRTALSDTGEYNMQDTSNMTKPITGLRFAPNPTSKFAGTQATTLGNASEVLGGETQTAVGSGSTSTTIAETNRTLGRGSVSTYG